MFNLKFIEISTLMFGHHCGPKPNFGYLKIFYRIILKFLFKTKFCFSAHALL